jgi:hypothetical protein
MPAFLSFLAVSLYKNSIIWQQKVKYILKKAKKRNKCVFLPPCKTKNILKKDHNVRDRWSL